MQFAHLHTHSEYSLLDGLSRIKRLTRRAKELGMDHLALTDHGNMYGAIEFYKACQATGLHPVLGCEAYLTEDMSDHSRRFSDDYRHLLLLARNDLGYRNLLKLTTIANTEGYHHRPRIDKKTIEKYAEGLIATSSCIEGEIPKMLLAGQKEQAYKTARWYQDVFGKENFYLELQEHHGVWDGKASPQTEVNHLLYEMHKDLQIPMIVTNDLHYIDANDAQTHDVLLCIQTGKQLDSPKRLRFDSQEYYLKSPEEMLCLFPELPDALLNTVRIAEQCEVNPLAYKASLPKGVVPPPYSSDREFLYALCLEGVKERYGGLTDPIKRRLDYEFALIVQKGFVPYFLVVWDYVHYARLHGIRCLARGSAAGSLLAYVLGITNVDPLRYQLLFERFLNPERDDMPDIDMDFSDDRRDEVIAYVSNKYGPECVAQMVTFNTMAAKQSVKDVARALGRQDLGDRITRLIPTGPKVTLKGSLESVKDLSDLYERSPEAREMIDQALELEGSVRNTGIHAAGVVIGNEALDKFVPLQLRDYKDPSKGLITQYEQMHLEELGLIKFDFLGLSNLTILDNTLRYIKESRGETLVLEKIPLDPTGDPVLEEKRKKAFDLLAEGKTTGIFQLEGAKMREYIKQLKPTCIEDITAMVALYRPGPMDSIPDFIAAKHGRKKVEYLDPRLKEWLEESYGIIVYQDQVLLIAVNLAGFSWGKVNKFRKALSKKKMDEVEGYKSDFLQGCVQNGVKPDIAEKLFELILPFGGYGFNKAHAASYAVVAFYTAYLKANYTAEFMAATMTTEAADAKKIANAIAECKRMGVEVFGPDINKSERGFTVEGKGVRFGLLAIKGIGEGPIGEILRARQEGGPFSSLADLCTRTDPKFVGKSVIEALIKVGALDSLAPGWRHVLLASVERAMQFGKSERAAKERGLMSLFGDLEEVGTSLEFTLTTDAEEIPRKQLLEWEKELLGLYLSEHPLTAICARYATTPLADISGDLDRVQVQVVGLIRESRRITTRKGEDMCILRLEDMSCSLPVIVFPRLYTSVRMHLVEGRLILLQGTVQARQEEISILGENIELIDEACTAASIVRITLHHNSSTTSIQRCQQQIKDLIPLLTQQRGIDQYEFIVNNQFSSIRLQPQQNSFFCTKEILHKIECIVGKDQVQLL